MIREVHEELGLRVEPDRLIAQVTRVREEQYYYLARVIGGQFGTGTGSEMLGLDAPERGTYRPVWMSFHQLNTLPGWPTALFHIVAKVPNQGWPESPSRSLTTIPALMRMISGPPNNSMEPTRPAHVSHFMRY
jgi:hypothetical protein